MNVPDTSSDQELAPMLERCHSLVQAASLVDNLKVKSTDKREQSFVDEVRYHAALLRIKTHDLSKDSATYYAKSTNQRNQDWCQLQSLTKTLLVVCRQLLTTAHHQLVENGSRVLSESGPKNATRRASKRSRFDLSKSKDAIIWTDAEMALIKDLISFGKAMDLIRKLNSILIRNIVWRLPDGPLRNLEDQVYHGIYTSNNFKALQPSVHDPASASGTRQPVLRLIVDFALDTLGLTRAPMHHPPAASNTSDHIIRETGVTDSKVGLRNESAMSSPVRSNSSNTHSTKLSIATDSLSDEFTTLTVGLLPGNDLRNGAPNTEEYENATEEILQMSQTSSPITAGSFQTNLGQQIQSLVQSQLLEDQRQKQMLEQRVSQLEACLSMANKKADQEAKRADEASYKVKRLESEIPTAVEALGRKFTKEMNESRWEYQNCYQDNIALQTKLDDALKDNKRMQKDLELAHKQSLEDAKELELLRNQMQQVRALISIGAAPDT